MTLTLTMPGCAARTALKAQPLYRALTPVRGGNLVFTDDVLAGAIYFTTPPSLPYVLEHLVPLLDKAVAAAPRPSRRCGRRRSDRFPPARGGASRLRG
jgi:hypothetical protein